MFLCALSALPESVHSTRIRTWRTDRDRLLALPHHPSSAPERAADHVCHHINSVDKGLTVFIVNHYQLRDCAAAEVLARSECHLAAESPPARSLTTAPSPPAPAPPSSSALPPTRLPATTLAICLGPPPSQRRSSANHSQRHRTPHWPLRLLPRPLRQTLRGIKRCAGPCASSHLWRRTRPTRGLAPPPSPRRHAPHLLPSPGGSRQLPASSSP